MDNGYAEMLSIKWEIKYHSLEIRNALYEQTNHCFVSDHGHSFFNYIGSVSNSYDR